MQNLCNKLSCKKRWRTLILTAAIQFQATGSTKIMTIPIIWEHTWGKTQHLLVPYEQFLSSTHAWNTPMHTVTHKHIVWTKPQTHTTEITTKKPNCIKRVSPSFIAQYSLDYIFVEGLKNITMHSKHVRSVLGLYTRPRPNQNYTAGRQHDPTDGWMIIRVRSYDNCSSGCSNNGAITAAKRQHSTQELCCNCTSQHSKKCSSQTYRGNFTALWRPLVDTHC